MIDIDELANQIHADVFDVAKSGIPLGKGHRTKRI